MRCSAVLHSTVFFVLPVAAVVVVVSSAASFDSRPVSFRFVSCRNSFAPAVADVVPPVVVSFHSAVVQMHYGFAVAAVLYFSALVHGAVHFADSSPEHDGQIDCCSDQFSAVAA